ncbi:hypothetical protein XENOCAPTIV_013919, partial [Xenoophorus captivus]
DLVCLFDVYLTPLQSETFLSKDEMEALFGSLPEMLDFQRVFLQTLEERIAASKTDGAFKYFLETRNPTNQHSSSLESYLIKPVQRVLKYPLLLRELVSLTDAESPEHTHLTEALRAMEKVASHINEMQKIYEDYGCVFDQLAAEQNLADKQVNNQENKLSEEPSDLLKGDKTILSSPSLHRSDRATSQVSEPSEAGVFIPNSLLDETCSEPLLPSHSGSSGMRPRLCSLTGDLEAQLQRLNFSEEAQGAMHHVDEEKRCSSSLRRGPEGEGQDFSNFVGRDFSVQSMASIINEDCFYDSVLGIQTDSFTLLT